LKKCSNIRTAIRRIGHEMSRPSRTPRRETTARRIAGRLKALGKWILEADRLPDPPRPPKEQTTGPRLSTWLHNQAPLPLSAQAAPTRKQFFAWLVASEPLPGTAAGLERTHTSILGWLLGGEKLATDQPPQPTKEASIHGS
jgi:hypothetical protein